MPCASNTAASPPCRRLFFWIPRAVSFKSTSDFWIQSFMKRKFAPCSVFPSWPKSKPLRTKAKFFSSTPIAPPSCPAWTSRNSRPSKKRLLSTASMRTLAPAAASTLWRNAAFGIPPAPSARPRQKKSSRLFPLRRTLPSVPLLRRRRQSLPPSLSPFRNQPRILRKNQMNRGLLRKESACRPNFFREARTPVFLRTPFHDKGSRTGSRGAWPDTLSTADAAHLKNYFSIRVRSLFHRTYLSSRGSHHWNYFWLELCASVPRSDAAVRKNPSPGVRCGARLWNELARSVEGWSYRIPLHGCRHFVCSSGGPHSRENVVRSRKFLVPNYGGDGDLRRQRHCGNWSDSSCRRRRDGGVAGHGLYLKFRRPASFSVDWRRASSIANAVRLVGRAGHS